MRTAEAYTVEFGGTRKATGSYSQGVTADTRVRLKIDPCKNEILVSVGDCRLHGPVDGMGNVSAAIQFGVEEIGGILDTAPVSADVPVCLDCDSHHFASEPCTETGTVTQHDRAYAIGHKYLMIGDMADVLIDSAALWVQRGDKASIVAARKLLGLFANPDDVADILYALVDVYHRDGTWMLDSIAPTPPWTPPAVPELIAAPAETVPDD